MTNGRPACLSLSKLEMVGRSIEGTAVILKQSCGIRVIPNMVAPDLIPFHCLPRPVGRHVLILIVGPLPDPIININTCLPFPVPETVVEGLFIATLFTGTGGRYRSRRHGRRGRSGEIHSLDIEARTVEAEHRH